MRVTVRSQKLPGLVAQALEAIMGKGKVVQVIGTVVDVEFPPDELPACTTQ